MVDSTYLVQLQNEGERVIGSRWDKMLKVLESVGQDDPTPSSLLRKIEVIVPKCAELISEISNSISELSQLNAADEVTRAHPLIISLSCSSPYFYFRFFL